MSSEYDRDDPMARLKEAAERAALEDVPDPEIAKAARKRMDATREALRSKIGEVDLAVPLVREARE